MWGNLSNAELLEVASTMISVFLVYQFLQHVFNRVVKKPSEQTRTRRRLDTFEEIAELLSQEREGTGNVCLVVLLRSKTKLLNEHVRKALVMLAKRQPMLRAMIKTSPSWSTFGKGNVKENYFEIINGHELIDLIDFTSSNAMAREWQNVWYGIASTQRKTGLLWRTVLLKEEFLSETDSYANTLIFRFNHSCIDGVSTMKFCKQFLSYLNKIDQEQGSYNKEKSSLSLMPGVTDLLKNGRPWSLWKTASECLGVRHLSKLIFKRNIRRFLATKQHNPFFVQFPPNNLEALPKSNLMFKIFSVTETSNIVKSCRSNGCTVTGALMAVAHIAFCELVKQGSSSIAKLIELEHVFSIDAQRDCVPKPHEEYFGQFALTQSITMQYTDEIADFWKLAQKTTKRIHHQVKEQCVRENLAVSSSFNPEEFVNQIISPPDRRDLIRLSCCNFISSAGSFNFDEKASHGTYKLHQCLYNSLCHGFAGAFSHFNTTVNGKMSWVILYDPSKVNGKQAEEFSNLCFSYFVKLAH